MPYLPSHQNSNNERNSRRQNHKDEIKRIIDAKKPLLSTEAAHAKFDKLASAFIAGEKVAFIEGNRYRVYVGAGKKFFPVYKIGGAFVCECTERERYGFCAHEKAAAVFAAKHEDETADNIREDEKPYLATLRFGNRKRLNFEKSQRFNDRREACEWLARESFNKFQPEGEVTDVFGAAVFEITNEFFELWQEV